MINQTGGNKDLYIAKSTLLAMYQALAKQKSGSYNTMTFYAVVGARFERAFAPLSNVIIREKINDAPDLDLHFWNEIFSMLKIAPHFKKAQNLLFFGDDKDVYETVIGVGLDDTNEFPEGADFPESIFEQLVDIFPELAQLKENKDLKPVDYSEYLQERNLFHLIKSQEGRNLAWFFRELLFALQFPDTNVNRRDIINYEGNYFFAFHSSSNELREQWRKTNLPYLMVSGGSLTGLFFPLDTVLSSIQSQKNHSLFSPTGDIVQNTMRQTPILLPGNFPLRDDDSTGYAKNVIGKFLKEVYKEHLKTHGPLFRRLGIPKDPLSPL